MILNAPWYKTLGMVLGVLVIIASVGFRLGFIPILVGVLLVSWYLAGGRGR